MTPEIPVITPDYTPKQIVQALGLVSTDSGKLPLPENFPTVYSPYIPLCDFMVPEIKFVKTHSDAKLPCKSKPERDDILRGDSGYDIFSVEDKVIPARGSAVVETGIQVGYISPGFWFRIEARSGLSFNFSVIPHFGVIDNPYRGVMGTKMYNFSNADYHVSKGDKIAQMIIYRLIKARISWTDKPEETSRGGSGFGSTGR